MPLHEGSARQFVFQPHQEDELFALIPQWDEVENGNDRPRVRDARDYLDLFVLLVDVGCRLRRALAIRWDHIVPLPGSPGRYGVRFYGKAGDKKSRDRTTPLTERTMEMLRRRHEAKPKSVGPFSGMTPRRSTVIFTWAKERSSFAHIPDAVVHSLRHTCATRLLELTGDIKLVQEWLGHSCLQTTSDTYAKVMTRGRMRGLDALEAFNSATRQVTLFAPFQDRKGSNAGRVFGQVIDKAALFGAKEGARTPTTSRSLVPKTRASTNSATFASCPGAPGRGMVVDRRGSWTPRPQGRLP